MKHLLYPMLNFPPKELDQPHSHPSCRKFPTCSNY